jgi:hypothetical protein
MPHLDLNVIADAVLVERSVYVGNPQNRDTPKRNAIAFQQALDEARRVMAGNEHLEVIEWAMAEMIFEELEKYVATFIPKGEDDNLWRAFLNFCNCDGHVCDEAFFERLDKEIEEFKGEYMSAWDGEVYPLPTKEPASNSSA